MENTQNVHIEPIIIAIDGPSGSGKSTICKLFSKKYNFVYLDTGAMYRAMTYHLLKKNISEVEDIIKELKKIDMTIIDSNTIEVNGEKLSKELRNSEIEKHVSYYSAIKEIREWLVLQQRLFSKTQNTILDGRDIGTVVFPNAQIKIYLEASIQERAKRRALERGESNFDKYLVEINKRDTFDSTRAESPLKKASDAIVINTTNMTLEEVFKKVEEIYLCFVK